MNPEQLTTLPKKQVETNNIKPQEKPEVFLTKSESGIEESELEEVKRMSQESDEKKLLNLRSEFQKISKKEPDDKEKQARETELEEQRKIIESSGSTELNRMLAYAILKDSIILHVAPSRTLSLSEKLKMLDDGLKKLAVVLIENPKIKRVQGSSWIMQENPRLVERLGFTVKDPTLFQKTMDKIFDLFSKKKAGGTYKNAFMNRVDFLDRYHK